MFHITSYLEVLEEKSFSYFLKPDDVSAVVAALIISIWAVRQDRVWVSNQIHCHAFLSVFVYENTQFVRKKYCGIALHLTPEEMSDTSYVGVRVVILDRSVVNTAHLHLLKWKATICKTGDC